MTELTTTWIDLTDLVRWQGSHVTGIQRVALNLAIRLRQRADVRFFCYEDLRRRLVEVEPDPLLSSFLLEAPREAHPGSSPLQLEQAARALAAYVPYGLRRWVPADRIKGLLQRVERGEILQVARRKEIGLRHALTDILDVRSREVQPASSDRLVLLGGGWAARGYQETMARMKTAHGCRVYELIYDLIPVIMPHTYGPGFPRAFASYLFEAFLNADGLLAISEATRNDIRDFCARLLIATPPIKVFRLGEDLPTTTPAAPATFSLPAQGFILTVGTIECRKNHVLLYHVWRLAQEEGVKLPPLVIVGKVGWLAHDLLYAVREDPTMKGRIHVLNDVSDGELTWLYANCLFTIFPSLYEGWGLPVAESLAHGRLCLTTRGGAIPEIAGDLIDYFSPFDPRACLNLILRYLDRTTLAAKEEQIRRSYRVWTWDEAFEQFVEVLASLDAVTTERS